MEKEVVDRLKEEVMKANAYKRALESIAKRNTRNRTNSQNNAIKEVSIMVNEMETTMHKIDDNFTIEGEINNNQSRENERYSEIRTKGPAKTKADEVKKIYETFKGILSEIEKKNEQEGNIEQEEETQIEKIDEVDDIKMSENEKRIEELNSLIKNWKDEIKNVWSKKQTEAAAVEIMNLRNLISNARKELDELNANGVQLEDDPEEVEPEEILQELKEKEAQDIAEKGRLKLSIKRLKEEREDYKGDKSLFDEYTRKIEEEEAELLKAEMTQNEKYKRITTLKTNIEGIKAKRDKVRDNKELYDEYTKTIDKLEKEYEMLIKQEEQKEKNIKLLTKGKIKEEKEKEKIEKEIEKKNLEISEIENDTENAMEEVELSSGEKVKQPKVLRLYRELDELKNKLKGKDEKIKEYQDAINKLKGIDKENTKEKLSPDEVRYYHGQGDFREYGGENGEDTRKNRLDNDKYYFENTTGVKQTPTAPVGAEQSNMAEKQEGDNLTPDIKTDDFSGIEALDIAEDRDIYSSSKDTIKKIRIVASSGKAYITSTRGAQTELDIEEVIKSKKQLFKSIKLDELLEERKLNTFFKKFQIKRKINPVILSAIQSNPDLVDEYLNDLLYWEKQNAFDYEVDLNNPNLSRRSFSALKRIAKEENKRGADVRGLETKRSKRKLEKFPVFEKNEEPKTREKKKKFVERINENETDGKDSVVQFQGSPNRQKAKDEELVK